MGWDVLAVLPWLVFFATGAVMVGVYTVAGLFGRNAGRIGEMFEGLFELASVLLMLSIFGSTVAVVVAAWIYIGWWAGLAFLSASTRSALLRALVAGLPCLPTLLVPGSRLCPRGGGLAPFSCLVCSRTGATTGFVLT